MAKSKETASNMNKSGKRRQSNDEELPMKKLPKMEKEELTPDKLKEEIEGAVADCDHEELSRLLAMKVNNVKFKMSECTRFFMSLLFIDEDYTHRRDDVLLCMRALLNDRRTSKVSVTIIDNFCMYKRDVGAAFELILLRHPLQFCERLRQRNFWLALFRGNHHVVKYLITKPFININRSYLSSKFLHESVDSFLTAGSHNPQIVPIILSHPLVLPDLRQRCFVGNRIIYRTALAIADNVYVNAFDRGSLSRAELKKRAVRNVRLLLSDDRVDPHQMVECSVDEGY